MKSLYYVENGIEQYSDRKDVQKFDLGIDSQFVDKEESIIGTDIYDFHLVVENPDQAVTIAKARIRERFYDLIEENCSLKLTLVDKVQGTDNKDYIVELSEKPEENNDKPKLYLVKTNPEFYLSMRESIKHHKEMRKLFPRLRAPFQKTRCGDICDFHIAAHFPDQITFKAMRILRRKYRRLIPSRTQIFSKAVLTAQGEGDDEVYYISLKEGK